MVFGYFNRTQLNYSIFYQNIEMVILSMFSFLLPIFLQHPQLLVGVFVNAFLIRSALTLKGYRVLPVIIMPSLGAVSAGILFGSLTKFLLYFVPMIWLGNALLVYVFKRYNKKNFFVTLISGSFFKALLLFSYAFILYSLKIVPVVFLQAMGIVQLATALLGGILVYGVLQVEKRWLIN